MSYTIDIYRGRLKPTKNILHFFSYLVMFPQLVAGPIVRAKDLLKQLETYKKVSSLAQWNGLKMIVYGFFRKVVIADNLAYLVDSAFENKSNFDGTLFWWVVSIAFSFQIYNDFSGYSLIARGIAKLMGYHFKMNFNHPYLSKSFRGFWQSWHISLSTWFRDYVYIPLGGSRKGNWKMISALAITFLLSGLWHGANYTFIVWALLHILFLLAERFVKPLFKVKTPAIISILVVFVFVNIAWVYFRASSIQQANEIVARLLSFKNTDLTFLNFYGNNIPFLFLAILIEMVYYGYKNYKVFKFYNMKFNLDIVFVVLSVLSILFLRGEGQQV